MKRTSQMISQESRKSAMVAPLLAAILAVVLQPSALQARLTFVKQLPFFNDHSVSMHNLTEC